MTKKIKNLRLSLTAIAFVLGIGAAFATNFENNDLPECGTPGTETCEPSGQVECCVEEVNEQQNEIRYFQP